MRSDQAPPIHPQGKAWQRPVAAILGLTVAAHGLLLPWLGFYWDDLPKSWFLHLLGPLGFWKVYQVDRPVLPWIYMFTTPLLGESPLAWQGLQLAARALTAVAVWWLIRLIWPRRKALALLTAMFFVVYPGFLQGPISLIYSHYFLLYALFLASLAFSVLALRGAARPMAWTVAGLTSLALVIFSFEYLVGLELVRPLIIGLVLWQAGLRRGELITRSLRTWVPYAAMFVAYLLWRALAIGFPTYDPELFEAFGQPAVAQLGSLALRVANDLYLASIGAWVHALTPPEPSAVGRLGLAAMGLAGMGAVVVSVWALRSEWERAELGPAPERRSQLAQGALLGGWCLLVAGVPIWTTLLPLELVFPWDRLTLPFMLGASLLAAALLLLVIRTRVGVAILACLLLGLGAASHAANAVTYVREWEKFNSFLAQMVERMPGLAPGTSLLTNTIPFTYYTDNSLTAPVNWAYAPDLDGTDMPYLVVSIPQRLGGSLASLQPGTPIERTYRATHFTGSTSQAIVLFYEPYDCLQVLDPVLHAGMPTLSDELVQALPLSRVELIDAEAEVPARSPFRGTDEDTWCLLFQQADLARQQGDWAQVVALGDRGLSGVDQPNDGSEYIPFIEGYAHVGRWEEARRWSAAALERNPEVADMLCLAWLRISAETPKSDLASATIDSVVSLADCEGAEP